MTKAERIYKNTKRKCRFHIQNLGYEENKDGTAVGFCSLSLKNTDIVSIRTINAICKILEKEKRSLALDIKLNVLSKKSAEQEEQVLNKIEITIKNQRERLEQFNQELKEL